jgi:hypothetical protein
MLTLELPDYPLHRSRLPQSTFPHNKKLLPHHRRESRSSWVPQDRHVDVAGIHPALRGKRSQTAAVAACPIRGNGVSRQRCGLGVDTSTVGPAQASTTMRAARRTSGRVAADRIRRLRRKVVCRGLGLPNSETNAMRETSPAFVLAGGVRGTVRGPCCPRSAGFDSGLSVDFVAALDQLRLPHPSRHVAAFGGKLRCGRR